MGKRNWKGTFAAVVPLGDEGGECALQFGVFFTSAVCFKNHQSFIGCLVNHLFSVCASLTAYFYVGTLCASAGGSGLERSNLVDSASSHTLVSKVKPCMSKYKQLYTVKLRMAHYISYSLFDSTLLLG